MPYFPKPKRKAYLPERKRKPTGEQSFYSSKAWRNTSKLYRQRNPLCEVCNQLGVVEPAKLVDHLVGRQFGGSDFDPRNLMAMCSSHHNSKSIRERYGLPIAATQTDSGLVPVERYEVVRLLTKS